MHWTCRFRKKSTSGSLTDGNGQCDRIDLCLTSNWQLYPRSRFSCRKWGLSSGLW
jgi:hypothetical protein